MSPGPLRRLAGGIGLAALAPTSYLFVVGQVSSADAAVRAGATLIGVMVLARVVRWCVSALAAGFERSDAARFGAARTDTPMAGPGRAGAARPATAPAGTGGDAADVSGATTP